MPLRPRSHVLEEENERAFLSAIPAEWVTRRQDPDYGIDLTVEIFRDGRATAMSFAVQLKATDEEDVSKALRSVRFGRDLADYYWAQPVPVLVVRYHAPTGELYARWWHAYNPLVAARPDDEGAEAEPTRTVGFVFSSADQWQPDTPHRLVEAVEHFRRFRSPDVPLPIRFNVSGADGADEEDVTRQLLLLRGLIEPVSDIVEITNGLPAPDQPSIVIGATSTTVALADVASITLDLTGAPPSAEQSAANMGCGIAMVLTTVGQPNLASQVAAACAPRSTLITGMHVAFTLAGAFFRSQRTAEVLTLIGDLSQRSDHDARLAGFALHTAVLARGALLSARERELAVDVARRSLERTLAMGDDHAAAGDAYNLASALAKSGDWASAVEFFDRACELDANYLSHAYFLYDLAACLFEAELYERAAQVAAELLALEDSHAHAMLLADAVMYSGRYEEAQRLFAERVADSVDPADGIWRLKHRVLDAVRATVGDLQDRRPADAQALAEKVDVTDPSLTIDQAWQYIEQALAGDALNGAAWHRMSLLSFKEDDQGEVDLSDVVEPAICAPVLAPWDEGLWINAIRIASAAGEPDEVIYDMARNGIFRAGHGVVAGVIEADTPSLSAKHLQVLDQATQDHSREQQQQGFRLRLRNADGTVDELVFGPDAEGDGS